MSTVTERTDAQFLQEILDLINGTHWRKGELSSECAIPLSDPSQAPEGKEIEELWRAKLKPEYIEEIEDPRQDAYVYRSSKKDFYVFRNGNENLLPQFEAPPERVSCYYKSKYCLIGMVLKVANLRMAEGTLDERVTPQPWRVVDLIYQSIDKDDTAKAPYITSSPVRDIEEWNDHPETTREDITRVVTRARDKATKAITDHPEA